MAEQRMEERVARLEQELGRTRWLNRVGGAVALFFLASSLTCPSEDSLRVRRLEVVNDKGEVVIELSSASDGGRILLREAPRQATGLAPGQYSLNGVIDTKHPENTKLEAPGRASPASTDDARVLIDPNGIRLRAPNGRETLLSSEPTLVPASR